MVHRPADSRLLSNLLQQEKDYLKQFNLLFNSAAASLDSITAYAAASPPPASQVILAVAGFLTAADDALKRYALGVEQWRDSMLVLKDMEDNVGNIMRDREILVTRLIKVSKSHKSNSGSGTFRELMGGLNSSSSLSLNHDSSPSLSHSRPASASFPTSTKLGAAQSELQGCETLLASKESELSLKRCAAVREGLTIRAKAMIDCSRTWGQLGGQILHSLDDLGIAEEAVPRDEHPPSDLSSIGPSQSASQIGQEAVPITGQPTPTLPRPRSVLSTAPSSLYYTPVTPATYKTETVTYAPAISLVVPASLPSTPIGSDINTPLALGPPLDVGSAPATLALPSYEQDTEVYTKMRIPAAHAINEYDIPTAEVERGTGTGTRRHSRGESLRRTSLAASASEGPNAIMSNMSSSSSTLNHQRHTLERRITEEDLRNPMTTGSAAPNRVVGSALIEVFDSPADDEEEEEDLPVEVNQLIKQGKLAVVENPRFMRRKELEREQMKLADQQYESDLEPEKKKFPFLHQHPKRTGTHGRSDTGPVPSALTTSAVPSTPNSKKSPSKRFFGSLRGLFGPRQPTSPQVPSQVQDPSPSRIRSLDSDADPVDNSGDESPTKTGGGFQALLRSPSAKKKVGSGGGGGTRWSTRTDKNIQQLTRSGDDDDDAYDAYLSQSVGKGAAGDVVAKAGLAGGVITGARGVRKTSASDIGTTPVVTSGSTVTGGRNKLKKTLAPPTVREHSSTLMKKNPQPAAPERRRATVDETARRTSVVQQGAVGQPAVGGGIGGRAGGGGGGKEVIVDLGKRRRTVSDTIPARGIPAATRPSAAAIPAESKGYSSDTATVASGQATLSKRKSIVKNAGPGPTAPSIPAAIPKVTPATTAAPSKSTLTRQTSAGKTQTGTTPNIPVDNANIKAGGSRHPQPHRQHSASSSTIVLPAGGTNPSGTLMSHPGWDAQALPIGGGLSRNNSIGSGVSGAAGGGGGGGGGAGGMSKKKQKQTVLGQGMGSGASGGRKISLGSSSGHGVGSVVQPTQPAQSLMSIVEDVAKHNRDWSQESSQLLKNRNNLMSVLAKDKTGPVGMVDVVRAPPRVGRDELAHLDSAMIRTRVTEASSMNLAPAPAPGAASSAGGGGSGGGGRLVDIKAPGSVFDQRKAVHQQVSSSTRQSQRANLIQRLSVTAGPAATSTPRPAKSPLRSALKNPSRTPSPLPSPFFGSHLQQQERSNVDVVAPQPSFLFGPQRSSQSQSTTASIRPTTTANGRPASHDSGSRRRKGKRQIKSASDQVAIGELDEKDSTSTNDTGDEIFYTDDEDDHPVSTGNMPMLNGHAVGSSDLSHSTTSTAVVHPTTTSSVSQLTTTSAPRRRKSVRVSLQPTFSPPPPAIDDDDEEEPQYPAWKQQHHHGGGQQLHVHAPVPVAGGSSTLLNRQKTVAPEPSAPVYDIWQNSSDDDAEYQNAKRLLTRAAKKEKDMFAARSR